MNNVEIKINNRIDVSWDGENYKSVVQDTGEGFIAISIPLREGIFLPLRTGDTFIAVYHCGSDAYEFQSQVIKRKNEGNLPLIYIQYPKKLKQVQRREYFRVKTIIAIQYVKITEKLRIWDAKQILMEKKGNQGLVHDISGGGLMARIQEQLRFGDIILIKIRLSNDEYCLNGRIVRLDYDEKNNIYYGISFIELERKIQEKIIQNIFEIERTQKESIGRGYL